MRWLSAILGAPQIEAQDRYVDDWIKGIDSGLMSATGLRVTVQDALTVPGISACIQVQAEDIAKVPLDLKRRTSAGYEPAVEHPLHRLLKFGPNPWTSPFAWRSSMAHAALAHGNDYSRVWRTESGMLEKITPIQTGRTTQRWTGEGEPFFDIAGDGGIERNLSWQDVIHVPYRGSKDRAEHGGTYGVSPIAQNKETVGLMLATERFAARFFANGARPSIAIEFDRKLDDDAVAKRLRASIERVAGGLDNAYKVMLLELGMKLKEFSTDPSDSQLIETRKEGAIQACMMYRTPPHKIGILDKATFSNIEQQSIDYVTGPISALARSIEAAITIACLTPAEREIYKVEHNLEALMRGDILSRYRAHAIGRQWGWLSANDVRLTENLNSIGPDGDQYLVPLNMAPPGTDPNRDDKDQARGMGHNGGPPLDDAGYAEWAPVQFLAFNPKHGANGRKPRMARLVGPNGERLYLH